MCMCSYSLVHQPLFIACGANSLRCATCVQVRPNLRSWGPGGLAGCCKLCFHTAQCQWSPPCLSCSRIWVAGRIGGSPRVTGARSQQDPRHYAPNLLSALSINTTSIWSRPSVPLHWTTLHLVAVRQCLCASSASTRAICSPQWEAGGVRLRCCPSSLDPVHSSSQTLSFGPRLAWACCPCPPLGSSEALSGPAASFLSHHSLICARFRPWVWCPCCLAHSSSM